MNSPAIISLVETAQDAETMAEFFNTVWGGSEDVAPMDIILAAAHVGGYAALVRVEGEVVAGCFGFLGSHGPLQVLHSHVTASTVKGLGYELKRHQRDWAAARGIDAITWTFDPLVRRNCVFNFEKLGAVAVEYLVNFYGTMNDAINRGDDSDRLFLLWPISAAAHDFAAVKNSQRYLVPIPEDIEGLRVSDPTAATAARVDLREQLNAAIQSGARIKSMNAERTALVLEF
ncbi:MAG: GNAT family N-acetyltransferase [Micrococcales bacterium]